jgi:hypothetical protein
MKAWLRSATAFLMTLVALVHGQGRVAVASRTDAPSMVTFTTLGSLPYFPPCEEPCLIVIRSAKALKALGELWQVLSAFVDVMESVGVSAIGQAFLQRATLFPNGSLVGHTPWIWQSPIHDHLHALAVDANAPATLVERLGTAIAAALRAALAKPATTQL